MMWYNEMSRVECFDSNYHNYWWNYCDCQSPVKTNMMEHSHWWHSGQLTVSLRSPQHSLLLQHTYFLTYFTGKCKKDLISLEANAFRILMPNAFSLNASTQWNLIWMSKWLIFAEMKPEHYLFVLIENYLPKWLTAGGI